jgi:hypothetical protein
VVVEGDHQPFSRGLVEPVEHGPAGFRPGDAVWFTLACLSIPGHLEYLDGYAVTARPDPG